MNAPFLVDPEGHKTAVVLPIEDFRALVERLEELEDFRLIEERKSEPRIAVSSLEELLAAVEAPDQPGCPTGLTNTYRPIRLPYLQHQHYAFLKI